MRNLEGVGEGGEYHRDPRADCHDDRGREPRRKRENTVHDAVANIVAISLAVTLTYLFLLYTFENLRY